jgi:NAD-dependent dihydropyrimidine dehydrogenase PreA subunit
MWPSGTLLAGIKWDAASFGWSGEEGKVRMPHVITEQCAKDGACLAVCPSDCISEGTVEIDGKTYDQLFVNPEDCIDCGLCEVECPVDAIFLDTDVPADYQGATAVNAEFFKSGTKTA